VPYNESPLPISPTVSWPLPLLAASSATWAPAVRGVKVTSISQLAFPPRVAPHPLLAVKSAELATAICRPVIAAAAVLTSFAIWAARRACGPDHARRALLNTRNSR
jgi:hypothetical protein